MPETRHEYIQRSMHERSRGGRGYLPGSERSFLKINQLLIYPYRASGDSADIMSENDLDNLLESIDPGDAINELENSTGEDIKPAEKENMEPGQTDTAVSVQVGGAIVYNIRSAEQ